MMPPRRLGRPLVSRVVSLLLVTFGLRVADDLAGTLGPDEWIGPFVPAVDVRGDGSFELLDVVERAAANRLTGDDPEEDLHHVQPSTTRRPHQHRPRPTTPRPPHRPSRRPGRQRESENAMTLVRAT